MHYLFQLGKLYSKRTMSMSSQSDHLVARSNKKIQSTKTIPFVCWNFMLSCIFSVRPLFANFPNGPAFLPVPIRSLFSLTDSPIQPTSSDGKGAII